MYECKLFAFYFLHCILPCMNVNCLRSIFCIVFTLYKCKLFACRVAIIIYHLPVDAVTMKCVGLMLR